MDLQPVLEQRAKVEEFTRKHRIGLLTLLFTDIVGSTKLKQELGDREAVGLIQRHHALIREILKQFSEGEEIETAGDSFFIVFAKPSDAVRFSLLLHAELREFMEATGRALQDRIGLHIGEVLIEDRTEGPKPKDLYGLQVDICARVASLAEGNQILMTRSAFDNARQVLKGEEIPGVQNLSWLNHGPYVLKGVEEPLEICEVGESGRAVLKSPPDSEKVHRYVSPDAEQVLGWRPALEQVVPGTSWILLEKLGEGGFGEVWLGRHKTTRERRVFKFCFRADRVRALKREVTLFRLLKERVGEHPNIVRLHEVFFDEPPFYLGMDYVQGRDLKSWSEERGGMGTIPLETRLEIVAQVAEALQAAHDAGVIHRDVKPSNILIQPSAESRPTVKLTDFGIGQVVSDDALAGITRLGFTQTLISPGSSAQVGTQLYMAPEVVSGKPPSIRSDIYALGVVLYQLIIGDFGRPVATDWDQDIDDPLLKEDLRRCFASKAEDRFSSAGELANQLRKLENRRKEADSLRAQLVAREKAAYRRGILRAAAVASILISVFALLVIYSLVQTRRARTAETEAKERASEEQKQRQRADEVLTRMELQKAEELFDTGQTSMALAYLARVLRQDPSHRVAAERLMSALTYRSFGLPLTPPLQDQRDDIQVLKFAPGGQQILIAWTNLVQIWDVQTGKPIADPIQNGSIVQEAEFSSDGNKFVTLSFGVGCRVWEARIEHSAAIEMNLPNIQSARFSPDGKLILTSSTTRERTKIINASVQVWDVATGQRLASLDIGAHFIAHAQFTGDNRRVIVLSENSAIVWDAIANTKLKTIELGSSAVMCTRDGMRIVSMWTEINSDRGSKSTIAGVWDVDSGDRISAASLPISTSFGGEQGAHANSAISPDGSRVVLPEPYPSRSVRILDLGTGEILAGPLTHESSIRSIRFSDDGLRLLTIDEAGTIRIWDAHAGKLVVEPIRCPSFPAPAWSADGTKLAASGPSGVFLWDLRRATALPLRLNAIDPEFANAPRPPRMAHFVGDDIVTASERWIGIWDAKTGQKKGGPIRHMGGEFALSSRGDVMATLSVTNSITSEEYITQMTSVFASNQVWLWNVKSGQSIGPPLTMATNLYLMRFSPDGSKLMTACSNQTAQVWDTAKCLPIAETLKTDGLCNFAEFSIDGRHLLTLSLRVGQREVLESLTVSQPAPLSWVGATWVTPVSPLHSSAQLWDVPTGRQLTPQLLASLSVHFALLSSDGERLATASADKIVRVWQVKTGALAARPMPHDAELVGLSFSPDGKRLVTMCNDESARIWNVLTGEPMTEPLRHSKIPLLTGQPRFYGTRVAGAVAGAHPFLGLLTTEFSSDGKYIVTHAGSDNTIRVWNVDTGKLLFEPIRVHENAWFDISPDGQRIVTKSRTTVRIWDSLTGHPVSESFDLPTEYGTVTFSQLGQHILTSDTQDAARIWHMPTPPLPVPSWIIDLTEAVAGYKLNELRTFESMPANSLLELKTRAVESSPVEFYTDWAKWFFADRSSRAISPWTSMTLPEYVDRSLHEDSVDAIGLAVSLSPTNSRALAGLARHTVSVITEHGMHHETENSERPRHISRAMQEAEFYCARAEAVAPDAPEVLWARAEILSRKNQLNQAISFLDRAIERAPEPVKYWTAKAFILERNNRREEAYQAFVRVIQLLGKDNPEILRRFVREYPIPSVMWGRADEMDWYSRRLTELVPNDAEVWRIRAQLLQHTSKPDQAVLAFDQALQRDKDNPALWKGKAYVLRRLNRNEEADNAMSEMRAWFRKRDPPNMQQSLITNGHFEWAALQMPEGWTTGAWKPESAVFAWAPDSGLDRSKSAMIHCPTPNDAHWKQEINVPPGQWLNLYGYMKGENIVNHEGGRTGANVGIYGTYERTDDEGSLGTFDWKPFVHTIQSPPGGKLEIACRLGHWGSTCTGRAWFDDIYTADDFAPRREGKNVYLILEKQDLRKISEETVSRLVQRLDIAHEKFRELFGFTPLDGAKIGIVSIRQSPGNVLGPGVWVSPGNPIKWWQRFVREELSRIEQTGDWPFWLISALGSNFDHPNWDWDSGLWNTIRMFYLIESIDVSVPSRNVVFDASKIEEDLKNQAELAKTQGTFDGAILIHRFIELKKKIGWKPFQDTFVELRSQPPDQVPMDKVGKFKRFLDVLAKLSNTNVHSVFSPEEISQLEKLLSR